MITVDIAVTPTRKIIDYGDASNAEFDLDIWRDIPVKDWPVQLQMDFWLTVSIFGSLHLVPKAQVHKYAWLEDRWGQDLHDLLEFL